MPLDPTVHIIELGTKGAYASGDVMHSCSDKIHTHRASMQFAKGTDES